MRAVVVRGCVASAMHPHRSTLLVLASLLVNARGLVRVHMTRRAPASLVSRSRAAPCSMHPDEAACEVGVSRGLLLLDSYERTTSTLLEEITDTARGDRIFFQLYLLEGGSSSEQVLAALEEAGLRRGVQVSFGLDVSYVSMLSRLTEKTTTLIPRVELMATSNPDWCTCTYGSKPDHSKCVGYLDASFPDGPCRALRLPPAPTGTARAVLAGMRCSRDLADALLQSLGA